MGDTVISVFIGLVVIVLFVVFPMLQMSSNNDNIAQVVVQSETSEFVATIASTGKITREQYDKFIQTLHATGNTYDVEFEIQISDGNSDKKTTTVQHTLTGEQEFFSIFTDEVEKELEKNGEFKLHKGNIITITVMNNNKTLFQTLQVFLSTAGDSVQITAKASATVGANGQ